MLSVLHRPAFLPCGDLRTLSEARLTAFTLGMSEKDAKDDALLEEKAGVDAATIRGMEETCDLENLT